MGNENKLPTVIHSATDLQSANPFEKLRVDFALRKQKRASAIEIVKAAHERQVDITKRQITQGAEQYVLRMDAMHENAMTTTRAEHAELVIKNAMSIRRIEEQNDKSILDECKRSSELLTASELPEDEIEFLKAKAQRRTARLLELNEQSANSHYKMLEETVKKNGFRTGDH